MPRPITIGLDQRYAQGALGVQDFLILAVVPAAAPQSLVGEPLAGQTLTATGVYRCLVPTAGIASNIEVYLNATWSGGTVVSDFDMLFHMSAFPTIPAKKGAAFARPQGVQPQVDLAAIEVNPVPSQFQNGADPSGGRKHQKDGHANVRGGLGGGNESVNLGMGKPAVSGRGLFRPPDERRAGDQAMLFCEQDGAAQVA